MKKIFTLTLTVMMAANMAAQRWDGVVATAYAGGNGTEASPYLIATPGQLAKIASDLEADSTATTGVYYKMTADVKFNDSVFVNIEPATRRNQLADYPKDSSRFQRSPIIGSYSNDEAYRPFRGHFDGAGHTISGMYVWDQKITCAGLFSVIENASVENLRITDSYFLTNANFGLMIGRAIDSHVQNCEVDSSYCEGGGSRGGLLVGTLVGSTRVLNSFAQGYVFGKNDMGGLFGRIGNGKQNTVQVDNCFSYVDVRLKRRNNGSLALDMAEGAMVDNCYWIALDEAKKALWTGAHLLGNNVRELNAEQFAADSLVQALNAEAQSIDGAYLWKTGKKHPWLDPTAVVNGISAPQAARKRHDGQAYNLSGQRVGEAYRGIVVVDGRKVIRK